MSKEQFVEDLENGEQVETEFSVKYKKPVSSYKRGYTFTLGLADRTGEIELKYWGSDNEAAVKRIYEQISEDSVIRVQGKVTEYQDDLQLSVEEGNGAIQNVDEYDLEDFVATTENDVDEMMDTLRQKVEAMEDEEYRAVIDALLDDDDVVDGLRQAPAAMFYHHAYIGGLLEHILSLIEIAETMDDLYPSLDQDLMTAGAIIHDIGKIQEFDVTTNITQSEEGLLRGHLSLGEEILAKALDRVDIDRRKAAKLHHIIVSHHGDKEYGTPKTPAFPEAAAIHHADKLDSQLFQHEDLQDDPGTDDFHFHTERFGQIYLE